MNAASLVPQFIQAKEKAGLSKPYLTSLRQYVTRFAEQCNGKPVAELTEVDVESWFAGRNEPAVSRASNLGRLSSFFSWAYRRRMISENPCRRIERVRVNRKSPEILTPEQVELLLLNALERKPYFVLWLALAVFAGIRPSELWRITREEVAATLPQGIVILDASKTKTHRRRVIRLTKQAVTWLEYGLKVGGHPTMCKMTWRRRTRDMRHWLSLGGWPQDILRHTALSFQLAESKDAKAVSLNAGNSPVVLMTNYNGLVVPEQLRAFLEILPPTRPSSQLTFKL